MADEKFETEENEQKNGKEVGEAPRARTEPRDGSGETVVPVEIRYIRDNRQMDSPMPLFIVGFVSCIVTLQATLQAVRMFELKGVLQGLDRLYKFLMPYADYKLPHEVETILRIVAFTPWVIIAGILISNELRNRRQSMHETESARESSDEPEQD